MAVSKNNTGSVNDKTCTRSNLPALCTLLAFPWDTKERSKIVKKRVIAERAFKVALNDRQVFACDNGYYGRGGCGNYICDCFFVAGLRRKTIWLFWLRRSNGAWNVEFLKGFYNPDCCNRSDGGGKDYNKNGSFKFH